MELAALVPGVVGVVLATLSLIWQAMSFLLTGPRVNVRLSESLRAAHGGVVVGPLSIYPDASRTALEDDGYTEHVFTVTATNAGRLPATVSPAGARPLADPDGEEHSVGCLARRALRLERGVTGPLDLARRRRLGR